MTQLGSPLVSVVMAVNRDDGFLKEAVESVLAQTYHNFEFLIIANVAPDSLWNYLKTLTDPRIKLFRNLVGGLPFNLNYGVNQAQGSLIARMDADDICRPERFAVQVEYLNAHPEVSVLGAGCQEINEQGQPGAIYNPVLTNSEIRTKMIWTCPLIHPTVVFRKDIFLKFRGYQFSLYAEDYDLWLRMRHDPQVIFANLKQNLLQYRIHGKQSSNAALIKRNFAIVMSLMMREFYLTKDPRFLASVVKRWVWSKVHR